MSVFKKLSISIFIATMVASTVVWACSVPDDEKALREAVNGLFESFNNRDVERHISYFAENAIELPPNRDIVQGKRNIFDDKKKGMESIKGQLRGDIEELIVSGDYAIIRIAGKGELILPDGSKLNRDDKAIMIWKHEADGSWKITHDIWNSNLR